MKEKDQKKEEDLKLAQIEAILFASGDPVGIEKIQNFLKLTKVQIKDSIKSLSARYDSDETGLQIVEKRGKIQLATKASLSEEVAEFLGKALNEELSKASLETLAVVAYRGPVTRVQIEYIRGVNCSYSLRTLSLRGIIDRKDNPLDSRSYLYEVSFEFLKSLGLGKAEDLNKYKELREQLPTEEDTGEKEEPGREDSQDDN
jgi:segregation and condensation protein B